MKKELKNRVLEISGFSDFRRRISNPISLSKFFFFFFGRSYMGSGYFGEMNMGNFEKKRSGSPGTAAMGRRGRKGGGGEKQKQPQRGLGVAQLEKIRLHGEMGCAAYGAHLHPNLSAVNLSLSLYFLSTFSLYLSWNSYFFFFQ